MNDQAAVARPAADPAHLGWRLLALVYDLVPLLALLMIASGLFVAASGGRTVEHDPGLGALEFVGLWLVCGVYFVLSWRRGGQTLGMRPWRLRLVADDGRPAAPRKLWLRYAVASLTPLVGLAWCLFDPRRRALHDMAAGTVLVRLRPAGSSGA